MRIFAILALVLGIVLAGGAVNYMYGEFRKMQALYDSRPESEPIKTVMVAVAKEELRFGRKISAESVRLVEWPADAAPANSFSTIEDLFKDETAQRTVLRQMEVDEVVLKSKVTGFGEEANVASLLRPGMRAHTLTVDSGSSVAGFLFPGSRVDIYLTYTGPSGQRTKLFMELAEIIAIDQTTDRADIKARVARTVTLEVTPEDSQRLILSERVGQLSFNLRGLGDETKIASASGEAPKDLSVRELLGLEEEVTAEEIARDRVVVRRGGFIKDSIEVDTADDEKKSEEANKEEERKEPTSN